ncbi:unnamed protein product, partial [Amoebophrya sp. A120]
DNHHESAGAGSRHQKSKKGRHKKPVISHPPPPWLQDLDSGILPKFGLLGRGPTSSVPGGKANAGSGNYSKPPFNPTARNKMSNMLASASASIQTSQFRNTKPRQPTNSTD